MEMNEREKLQFIQKQNADYTVHAMKNISHSSTYIRNMFWGYF